MQHRQPDQTLQLPDNLHPLIRRVLLRRRLGSSDELDLSLSNLLAPDSLLGVEGAVALLTEQLQRQGRLLVVSDFDADGATSCALALRGLRALGFENLDYIVPNRFEYGYGLTPEIVQLATARKPDLIITVDNGISSLAGVDAARRAGVEVLITDHHLPGAQLPAAAAIVNPNQPGCEFASKALAGVGVMFYLLLALRASLREAGYFAGAAGRREPNLAELLDLVALGTVADVVPLDRNNRILVNEGLKRIRAGRACPGILALLQVSRRRREGLVAADLGFAIGPRLNAAGRLDDMSLGIECLLTDSMDAAHAMAVQLDSLNSDRRLIEGEMREQAFRNLDRLEIATDAMPAGLCVYDSQWHQGVIGILASRIKDKYHRPVIAFADAGVEAASGDELKGSARSIPGFHIRDALDAIASRHPGLISRFGGHAMAAGLSLEKGRLNEFQAAFADYAGLMLEEEQLQARLVTDGELGPGEFAIDTAEAVIEAGPWGQGFPEPLFDGRFVVQDLRVLADKHLKMAVLPDGEDLEVEAIAFNASFEDPLQVGDAVRLVYRLGVNDYRDLRRLQLVVEAFEKA
ncbi:MAG: single-stranded-DNA-specific exonuclease RecJ [Pseudomonadales bacterium]|nr:single-stranded-DNA-specific exonuclease RecJ [Pseudomonadales bacterium]